MSGITRYRQSVADFGAVSGNRRVCEFTTECDDEAVYAFVWPSSDGQPIHCCAYHVARYQAEYPQRYRRFADHESLADPSDFQRDDRFVTLDETPPRIRGGAFRRVGLDERGLAHYYQLVDDDEAEGGRQVRLLLVDRSLDTEECFVYDVGHIQLGDWLAHVEDRRSWVAVDQALLDRAPRGAASQEGGRP